MHLLTDRWRTIYRPTDCSTAATVLRLAWLNSSSFPCALCVEMGFSRKFLGKQMKMVLWSVSRCLIMHLLTDRRTIYRPTDCSTAAVLRLAWLNSSSFPLCTVCRNGFYVEISWIASESKVWAIFFKGTSDLEARLDCLYITMTEVSNFEFCHKWHAA